MMRKYREILWTLLGVAAMAALVFAIYRSEQPDPVVIDLSEQAGMSEQHKLVSEALRDTDAFAEMEEAGIEDANPTERTERPLPVTGTPLPIAWESAPAPEMGSVSLSPALARSISASAELRSDRYTNPSSELNLKRIAELREIRQNRHKE